MITDRERVELWKAVSCLAFLLGLLIMTVAIRPWVPRQDKPETREIRFSLTIDGPVARARAAEIVDRVRREVEGECHDF